VIALNIERHRRGNLELMYYRRAIRGGWMLIYRLAFVVDDENSRNASDMSGDPWREPG
jgi:hypothetical protein